MRKLSVLLLFLISLTVHTQEINEAYLDSLPVDMQQALLARIAEKEGNEEKVYRSIEASSDLKKKNIERGIFGGSFFDTMQSSFMPTSEPSLDDNYILDSSDVLRIQLIGQKDSIDSYQITRDGSINLPDIGKLYLSGLSLNQASKIIAAKVNQTYIGVEAYVSLKNIRDVNVLVSGNAYNPGVYTLNGNSNILHALHAAGGIDSYGSYRSIKLIRNDKVIETLDIYKILIDGKVNIDTRLRTGDIIFVEPRANVVLLEGAFKRSMQFELLDNQNLSDAIYYANGVSVDADLSNIFLYRMLDGEIQDIEISSISQFDNIKVRDFDRVYVRNHSFRNVKISGAVLRPGSYKLEEGDTIFDLIEKSGGYTKNAFPNGIMYFNDDAYKISQAAIKKLYQDFLDELFQLMQLSAQTELDVASLVGVGQEIRSVEPNGRIVLDIMDDTNPVLMKNNDTIFVPEKTSNIYIFGEILYEGSMLYKEGADLNYYLSEASGVKDSADLKSIYILYPNGRTAQLSKKRNLFAAQPHKANIEPGSIIYIPRKLDNSLSNRLTAQAYATILGNIGLSLASVSAINNN